jgi:hypothetical protein
MTLTSLPTSSVRVDVDRVVFNDFVEHDRHVVEAFAATTDPEGCAHELLHLGAHLAGLAAGTGGLAELEARVGARLDALAGAAETTVTTGLAALAEQSKALLGAEDGDVAGAITTWLAGLDARIGDLFDPDRKASVIALIETSLSSVLDAYGRKLAAATDPDVDGSPAGRLLAQVRANAAELKAEMAALTMAVGVERGREAEHARTAVKGLEFEPAVVDAVATIAAPHGDLVEHVGRTTGTQGTKKGDVRVVLCDDDIPGGAGAYIVEAKDRRLTLDTTWRELDAAMANWDATAAVAVFAAGNLAPTDLPFWYSGDKAVVVLDRGDPDPAPLALACLFARWVVRRRWAPPGTGPDPERMAASIDRIQRALARVSTIRRNLSTSAKATGDAREQLDELAGEIRAALAELSAELDA